MVRPLSDEAILRVTSKERERQKEFGYEAGDIDIGHMVAQEALEDAVRLVVEWGLEVCPHELDTLHRFQRRECPRCWQELKKQIGDKK